MGWMILGSYPGRTRVFIYSATSMPALGHIHPSIEGAMRLRTSGGVLPLPLYDFTAQIGTILLHSALDIPAKWYPVH
jgi:hypothetical protein